MMSLKEMQESLTAAKKTNARLTKLRKQLEAPTVITPQNIPKFTLPHSYLQLYWQSTLHSRLAQQDMQKTGNTDHFVSNLPCDKNNYFKRTSMPNILTNFSKSIWDMFKKPQLCSIPNDGHDDENGRTESEEYSSNNVSVPSWSSVLQKTPQSKGVSESSRCMTILGKRLSDGFHIAKSTNHLDSNSNEDCIQTSSIKGGNYMSNWNPLQGTQGNIQMSEILKMGMEQLVRTDQKIGVPQQMGIPQQVDDTNEESITRGMGVDPPTTKTYAMCFTGDVKTASHDAKGRAASVDSILPTLDVEERDFFLHRPSLSETNSKEEY